MGKSKKRSRTSANRANPLQGNKNNNNKKDNATVTKKILPLLQKLTCAVPNDRSMALQSITVLCEDPHMRKLMLKEKLVHIILSNLLTDNDAEIVVEAYGLLRNIALEEGYDVSTYLWRSNIWLSIVSGFEKVETSLTAIKDAQNKSTTESKRMVSDLADNLLSLLVALCNGSDDILNEVLESEKLSKIFKFISTLLDFGYQNLPINLFNTILDLIYDFSSESFSFITNVTNDSKLSVFVKTLPELMNDPHFNELTKVLIQGIYLQFLDMDITPENINEIVRSIQNSINDIDLATVKSDLSITAEADEQLMKADDSKVASKIKDYTKRRNLAMMRYQSIEIAIDLITASTEILASLYEEKNNKQLPDQLIDLLTVILPNIFQALSAEFTSRILIAWNNLLWLYITLGVDLFESEKSSTELVQFISGLTDIQASDLGIKMGRYSVIWALLKTVSLHEDQLKYLQFLQLSNNLSFVNAVIEDYNNAAKIMDSEDHLELRQRCCDVLSAYATFQGQVSINQAIGKFFLSQLISPKTPQSLLVDISNMFFEIYCDGQFDYDEPVFVQEGFLKVLKEEVVPNLRKMFKLVDKNKEPELKEKCNVCFNTLDSFIHYKASEKGQ
ncbi:hypothetical protein Kpol_483p15 [Vanderwaltozyma polyspora DSM 70294]|uniref:SYO1-like TPR repeats domain-containing protein n=1 Tax=Vanderwaltozyma polyspora (strain ATCC 22028 / DSM 70294 / BCRC 21397 / CBS 2163 / NBRC 10782 / NRRL Y-8283 / UCD 57-17) TaxID=436907 RepID=A7TQ67_VANPO|nr:uncharacterized protein Kpol_483p15 [Vanderwaltozyma polyspora DSM 70294]EDO15596.1 hypothetical protein Kpol_483p15 [Vanderwaltozyma polyspora DSM 70294]